ncbi:MULTISPECIES: heme oxygenase [unclassified Planococcus (in: firmicutes)]|uniref:heme oxygenase n=1 Tax=Planococcus TaxID=1372 RepID=UPI0011EBE5B5|nr:MULTISPECIES: heme oxygenase [unclassified Planococcus (in: firmicutes)]KAA0956170.1 heme oxygenase [Planococcus sp. ANT_H30]MDJ0332248.1 heme oxygenase [Planococcus sp. S3-L1]
MYIVTNRIKMKSGFAEKMAPNFSRPGALQEMDGFIKVEVAITQDSTEYDELNVSMYWETLENYEAWKTSDVFKEAHKRPAASADSNEPKKESPMLGSQLTITKIVGLLEAKTSN